MVICQGISWRLSSRNERWNDTTHTVLVSSKMIGEDDDAELLAICSAISSEFKHETWRFKQQITERETGEDLRDSMWSTLLGIQEIGLGKPTEIAQYQEIAFPKCGYININLMVLSMRLLAGCLRLAWEYGNIYTDFGTLKWDPNFYHLLSSEPTTKKS